MVVETQKLLNECDLVWIWTKTQSTIWIWCCGIRDAAIFLAGKGLKFYIFMLARSPSSTLAHVNDNTQFDEKVLPGTEFGEHRLGCRSRFWRIPQIPSMYSPWHRAVPSFVDGGFWCEGTRPPRLRSSFGSGHLGLIAACQAQASDINQVSTFEWSYNGLL